MADKRLEYEVVVKGDKAVSELKKVGEAGEKAGKQLADGFKDVGSKSDAAFDKVIGSLKQVTEESKRTIETVGKIGDKFGEGFDPQATAKLVNSLRQAGVEFDTIEARADELADTMRQIDSIRIEGPGAGLRDMSSGMDAVRSSAHGVSDELGHVRDNSNQSRSVLANLSGNAAQDLGELGGVVGSLGVGIGQLAEYAVDGNIKLNQLASVAGPMAGLSAALLVVQTMMKNISETKAFDKKQAEEFAAAIDDVGDSYAAVIQIAESGGLQGRVQGGGLLNEVFPRKETVDLIDQLDRLGLKIADVQEVIRSGARFQEFPDWMAGGSDAAVKFNDLLAELEAQGLDTSGMLETLREVTAGYTDANIGAAAKARVFASTMESVNEQLRDIRIEDDPLSVLSDGVIQFGDVTVDARVLWRQFVADLADGNADMEATAMAADVFAAAMHLSVPEVLALADAQNENAISTEDAAAAIENITEAFEGQTEAVADGIQAWKDHTEAVQEAAISIGKVLDEIPDVAGALEAEFGKVDDIFSGLAFDVDFQPALDDALDDLNSFEPDLQTVADRWADILRGQPIDIFGNVRADDDEFMERIGKLRDLFQEGVVNAFGQGGIDAANTFVQSTAAQIAASTGLDISEVYRIMGLGPDGSVTALIEPEIDQTHADQARAILDALAGVEGGEAREARIHVALETGAIDGDIAFIASQLLAHEALGIPVDLSEFSQADVDEAQAFLDGQTWTASIEPEVSPPAQNRTDQELEELAAERTATYVTEAPGAGDTNTELDNVGKGLWTSLWGGRGRVATYRTEAPGASNLNKILDAIARTRTAQINLNTNPDVFDLNHAIDFASRDRTTHITLVSHAAGASSGGGTVGVGGASFAPTVASFAAPGVEATSDVGITPFAAPTVSSFAAPVSVTTAAPSTTVHNHVTISAAVIGSRFDVQRAVTKALRSAQRLNGARV
jgi:hypothetical protein